MLRCDPMSCCDIFLQPQAAFQTMLRLGEMGCIQFIDMNPDVPPNQKKYLPDVCRCAEMERKLRYIESEMVKDNIDMPYPEKEPGAIQPSEMLMYENLIDKWQNDIFDMSQSQVSLMQDVLEMKEMHYVLNNMGPLLGDVDIGKESIFARYKTGGGDVLSGGRLTVVTGVVKRTRSFAFELMMWRISRGNIFYRQATYDEVLTDPYTGSDIRKVAFIAVCQGDLLSSRMEKVFTGFRVNIYPCPETKEERFATLSRIDIRISDLEEVLAKSKYYRCKSLRSVGKMWQTWMFQVRKTKAVYHSLNLFSLDITKNCLIGQCWVPDKDIKRVQDAMESCSVYLSYKEFSKAIRHRPPTSTFKRLQEEMDMNVTSFMAKTRTDEEPPTYNRTNKFTNGFQVVINAYGDAKYREVNPAIFSVISFPFLFAVMFGDSGHAVIILSFAFWMIIMEKTYSQQRGSEIWNILFGGRYVILLLGFFSLYTGFVYNELFNRSINLSSSMYKNVHSEKDIAQHEYIDLNYKNRISTPYVYGMDPIWQFSKNQIMLANSIKMKMSIIIGVVHMLFGIALSTVNFIMFKEYHAIFLEFIPAFVFLSCIFFWLILLIFIKWFTYWDGHNEGRYNAPCAPSILLQFIDMVLLGKGTIPKDDGVEVCKAFLFDGQRAIQFYLVLLALLMIPILLFGTPVYKHLHNRRMRKNALKLLTQFRKYQKYDKKQEKDAERVQAEIAKYSSSFPDMMIIQGVCTIEFVLSTISHTASYLRLWALSLAHAQLSEMLWEMVLSRIGLQDRSNIAVIKIFVAFAAWAAFTVAILVVMEGLSAFLHTLRLHWVEFMSKFFIGGGTPFRPFSFKALYASDVDKPEGACKLKKTRDKFTMQDMDTHKV